ncbi:MAG: NADH-quinone oxidoreductase subunit C [Alicyclobacillus sp.]|nr:NADH-quinone oxidoreductase subunit C [Alicyclobacillus sp.]
MKTERIRVSAGELPDVCADLVRSGGWRFLTMVASDEREAKMGGFVLRYLFSRPSPATVRVIETVVPEDRPAYPSVSQIVPAASWAEREARDLLGVEPLGHPDPRPLVFHDHWPTGIYPLRKDYPVCQIPDRQSGMRWTYPIVEGEGVHEVRVGPIHAGIIEPGHFRFQVMGDSVLHLEAQLFYTHRGLEKRCEGMPLSEGLRLAEHICGVCSVSHALSYCQAVEGAVEAEIPPRAQYLRVLFAELERLYNHIGDIGNLCAGVGYAFGSQYGARLKERLMQLNDALTGHRFLRGNIVLGGVANDIQDGTLQSLEAHLQDIRRELRDIVSQIQAHEMVVYRFRGTGILPHQAAVDFAAVGPAARASSCDVDARRDLPYAAYPRLFFEVPVLKEGDVWARFLERTLEAEQSFHILQQVLDQLPDGPVRVPVVELPAYHFGIGVSESPRGDNVHFVMAGPKHSVFRYRVRSASYANWPVVPLCVPGNIIADFPLINKSFELCYACCDR